MNLEQLKKENKEKLFRIEQIGPVTATFTSDISPSDIDQITTTSYQAGVRDAMEAVDKAKAKIEEIEEPVASGCIYKSYVYEILDEALSALIQE